MRRVLFVSAIFLCVTAGFYAVQYTSTESLPGIEFVDAQANLQVTDATPVTLSVVPFATSYEATVQDAAGTPLDTWHNIGPGPTFTVGDWLSAFPPGTYKLNARGVNAAGVGPNATPVTVEKIGAPTAPPVITVG